MHTKDRGCLARMLATEAAIAESATRMGKNLSKQSRHSGTARRACPGKALEYAHISEITYFSET
jgi:hypothetical protein